jgi:hypothetical protein
MDVNDVLDQRRELHVMALRAARRTLIFLYAQHGQEDLSTLQVEPHRMQAHLTYPGLVQKVKTITSTERLILVVSPYREDPSWRKIARKFMLNFYLHLSAERAKQVKKILFSPEAETLYQMEFLAGENNGANP